MDGLWTVRRPSPERRRRQPAAGAPGVPHDWRYSRTRTLPVVVVETLTSQSAFNYSANLFIWRLFGIRLASDLFRPLEPLLTCSTSRSVALFRETVARLAGREPPTAVPGPFPAKHTLLLCVLLHHYSRELSLVCTYITSYNLFVTFMRLTNQSTSQPPRVYCEIPRDTGVRFRKRWWVRVISCVAVVASRGATVSVVCGTCRLAGR